MTIRGRLPGITSAVPDWTMLMRLETAQRIVRAWQHTLRAIEFVASVIGLGLAIALVVIYASHEPKMFLVWVGTGIAIAACLALVGLVVAAYITVNKHNLRIEHEISERRKMRDQYYVPPPKAS